MNNLRFVTQEPCTPDAPVPCRVWLEQCKNGVVLTAQGIRKGSRWSIALLRDDGKLFLYGNIPEDSGMQVDQAGVIQTDRFGS